MILNAPDRFKVTSVLVFCDIALDSSVFERAVDWPRAV